jgi:DNA-binding transcriptional LysR family regulator
MNLTLRQLRYAVTTASLASVSKAAEKLHVTQPSISASIDQIETQFGRKIFIRRRGTGASLTPFGRSVIDQARRALEEIGRLEHLGVADGQASGEVVLGCYDDLAPYCVPALT